MEDIALHMLDEDPDLRSVGGDGIVKMMLCVDATAYRAEMAARAQAATRARSDATWEKAILAVYGSVNKTEIKPDASHRKSDDVWDRAYAKLYPGGGR